MNSEKKMPAPAPADLVRELFGDIDDLVVARIVATGADAAEIAEAHAWIHADDQLGRVRQAPPKGRVAEVVEIVRAEIEPPEDPILDGPGPGPD